MEFDLLKADGQSFVREVSGPDSAKLASDAGLFVAQKLRERSFARQILTPTAVSAYDLQVKTVKGIDQMYYVHEKEVNVAPASAINFKGEPENEYITGERYDINIFEIASKLFQKKEIELLSYRQPIVKLVEDNTVREIEEIEDVFFLQYADAAAAAAGNTVSVATGAGGALTRIAVKTGQNLIDTKRLICRTLLMSKKVFNDFSTMVFSELGSDLLKEVFVNGYTYHTFMGLNLIVSIKDSLFRHPTLTLASGEKASMVYFFAEERALGKFIVLDSTKFGVERRFQTLGMMAWEYIGIGFGNNSAIARVTLLD